MNLSKYLKRPKIEYGVNKRLILLLGAQVTSLGAQVTLLGAQVRLGDNPSCEWVFV